MAVWQWGELVPPLWGVSLAEQISAHKETAPPSTQVPGITTTSIPMHTMPTSLPQQAPKEKSPFRSRADSRQALKRAEVNFFQVPDSQWTLKRTKMSPTTAQWPSFPDFSTLSSLRKENFSKDNLPGNLVVVPTSLQSFLFAPRIKFKLLHTWPVSQPHFTPIPLAFQGLKSTDPFLPQGLPTGCCFFTSVLWLAQHGSLREGSPEP